MVTQAVAELDQEYDRTFRRLCAFFRGRGVSPDEATDLAQDTAGKVWLHLERHGRTCDNLDPLIYRIASNVLTEFWRTRGPVLESLEGKDVSIPRDDVGTVDARIQVDWLLKDLPRSQRRVMAMFAEGLKPAEIARSLGIKRNAVDQLLHRARRVLASRFDPRAVAGAIGVLAARVRVRVRALSQQVGSTPLTEMLSVHGLTLVTFGLAAVLSVAGVSSATVGDHVRPPASVEHSAGALASQDRHLSTTDAGTHASAIAKGGNHGTAVQVGTDVEKQQVVVKVGQRPGGKPPLVEVDVWHRRGHGHRGVTGPLLDQGVSTVCGSTGPVCDEVSTGG